MIYLYELIAFVDHDRSSSKKKHAAHTEKEKKNIFSIHIFLFLIDDRLERGHRKSAGFLYTMIERLEWIVCRMSTRYVYCIFQTIVVVFFPSKNEIRGRARASRISDF